MHPISEYHIHQTDINRTKTQSWLWVGHIPLFPSCSLKMWSLAYDMIGRSQWDIWEAWFSEGSNDTLCMVLNVILYSSISSVFFYALAAIKFSMKTQMT